MVKVGEGVMVNVGVTVTIICPASGVAVFVEVTVGDAVGVGVFVGVKVAVEKASEIGLFGTKLQISLKTVGHEPKIKTMPSKMLTPKTMLRMIGKRLTLNNCPFVEAV